MLRQRLLQSVFRVYYPYARLLNRLMPNRTIGSYRLLIAPSVYKPLENEHRYGDFVKVGDRVCDLGCGSGIVSVAAAERASRVLALDISADAVAATRANCQRHQCSNVEVRRSDLFAATEESFDLICVNPPLVEVPMDQDNQQWATSGSMLPRLFRDARAHLAPGGRIVALYPKRKGERLVRLARLAGLSLVHCESVGRKSMTTRLLKFAYLQLFSNAHFYVFRPNNELTKLPPDRD